MNPVQSDPEPWRKLSEALAGSFAARAHGLLASDFVLLDRENGEIGHLELLGPEGATIMAKDLRAQIERLTPAHCRMLSSGAEILTSTGDPTSPEITCLGHFYSARLSLLRNKAEAGQQGDEKAVRIAGGLTNRNYEVSFSAGVEGSLPLALFLLYRLVSLRREAYRTGHRRD
jgi:hypothetical protein